MRCPLDRSNPRRRHIRWSIGREPPEKWAKSLGCGTGERVTVPRATNGSPSREPACRDQPAPRVPTREQNLTPMAHGCLCTSTPRASKPVTSGQAASSPDSGLRPSFLERACAGLALAAPLAVTLWRIPPDPTWAGDLTTVRGVEMLPVFGSGALSSWLAQPLLFLPLGCRASRLVMLDAVAVAFAGRLVYGFAHTLLSASARTPRLAPLLALAGALLASLGSSWQCQGTVAGGGSVAAVLVLGLIALCTRMPLKDARFRALLGVFVALVFFESLAVGLIASVLIGVALGTRREARSWRLALCTVGAALVAMLVLAVPGVLRPQEARQWLELGDVLPGTATMSWSDTTSIIGRCSNDQGILAVTMAVVGALVLAFSPALRRVGGPWLVLASAVAVVESTKEMPRAGEVRMLLMLLSVAGIAALATLGVQSLSLGLVRIRVPFATPVSALLVACFLALSLVNGEDSALWVERRHASATRVWTDEALASLPKGAVLLVSTPDVVWRLWAARATGGDREDLILVPLPLLERGAIVANLLQREPALAHLMRDLAVKGRASEFSMSTLADARPVFVDVGADWEPRLLDHLIPRSLWLEFAPHALGRSDREAGLREGRGAFKRVLNKACERQRPDVLTLAVLARRAKERAVVHAALGDRDALEVELADLETMGAEDEFVREVRRRLQRRSRGAIDIGGLLVLGTDSRDSASG